jgi:hypothetical protein
MARPQQIEAHAQVRIEEPFAVERALARALDTDEKDGFHRVDPASLTTM